MNFVFFHFGFNLRSVTAKEVQHSQPFFVLAGLKKHKTQLEITDIMMINSVKLVVLDSVCDHLNKGMLHII